MLNDCMFSTPISIVNSLGSSLYHKLTMILLNLILLEDMFLLMSSCPTNIYGHKSRLPQPTEFVKETLLYTVRTQWEIILFRLVLSKTSLVFPST